MENESNYLSENVIIVGIRFTTGVFRGKGVCTEKGTNRWTLETPARSKDYLDTVKKTGSQIYLGTTDYLWVPTLFLGTHSIFTGRKDSELVCVREDSFKSFYSVGSSTLPSGLRPIGYLLSLNIKC